MGRYLVAKLSRDSTAIGKMAEALRDAGLGEKEFGCLLQIILLARPQRDVLRELRISLEGRNLRCVRFTGKDLSGVAFRNSILSDAVFDDCDLRDAQFEGALLEGTRFERIKEDMLRGARFGDMDKFHSVYDGRQRVEDYQEAIAWVQRRTGQTRPVTGPCPTAQQLRKLFGKYIHPDGQGRRDEHREESLLRGKRFPEAPAIKEFVKACQRLGYLTPVDAKGRVRRGTGRAYDEMVQFVSSWRVSPNMRTLLAQICGTTGCRQFPCSQP